MCAQMEDLRVINPNCREAELTLTPPLMVLVANSLLNFGGLLASVISQYPKDSFNSTFGADTYMLRPVLLVSLVNC